MKEKIVNFVLFCWIFWLINQAEGQVAKCDYKYDYHWINGYKTINVSYYKCDLDTRRAYYYEKLTRIDGQHGTRRSDADVKWIATYKDQKLRTFSSIFCRKFPNLEVIRVNEAELESIDEDSLQNCQNLNHLLLLGDRIRELKQNLLIRNPKLTLLWIRKNQLTTLPENLFLNQRELESLELEENQINFLPSNIFHPLVKLELLQLFNNKLESLNPEWFRNLYNLKRLGMNGNQISEIPSKCFLSLRNLEIMFFYENRIKTLNSASFDGLQNLQVLSLYSNEISDLPAGVFTSLINLQQLSLYNNKLTTIHSDSFAVLNRLSDVFLGNNNINSIDPRFIDITAASIIDMRDNICSQLNTGIINEKKANLKNCFDNYQHGRQPQSRPHVTHPSSQFLNQFPTLNQNICGKRPTGHGDIIGGSQISRGSFPWIAALVTPAGKFFCGGTVISKRKVLTAAHCIQDKHASKAASAGEILVVLGVHDLNKAFEVGRFPYGVQKVNVHPDWNTLVESFDADITVLVLESEVTFNKFIQPICMPNSNVSSLRTGVVVGFGKSKDETKIHENIPKMLETPIHTNEHCFFHNYILVKLSSRRTFCGGTGTGIGVCRGDSGSGLFVSDGSAYFLRGIVSSSIIGGRYGCDVDTYSVFTDVTKYIDWIDGISTSRF